MRSWSSGSTLTDASRPTVSRCCRKPVKADFSVDTHKPNTAAATTTHMTRDTVSASQSARREYFAVKLEPPLGTQQVGRTAPRVIHGWTAAYVALYGPRGRGRN